MIVFRKADFRTLRLRRGGKTKIYEGVFSVRLGEEARGVGGQLPAEADKGRLRVDADIAGEGQGFVERAFEMQFRKGTAELSAGDECKVGGAAAKFSVDFKRGRGETISLFSVLQGIEKFAFRRNFEAEERIFIHKCSLSKRKC